MWLLQHQGQPFIQYYCSPSTAQLAASGTKWDGFIKQSPLFPIAQVHLQGKSLLHAAVAGVTASLGTGYSRVLSLGTSIAGTSDHRCWNCKGSACCESGLQFSGSCELKTRVDKRKSKQGRGGHSSDPNFVSIISPKHNFCLNRVALRNHAKYTTVEQDITTGLSPCSQQGRKRHLQLFNRS